ncbi:hypothetical protein CSKR_104982 [Clonorchis sinensis]|uniref:Uncharacterized protein n=1 Tax=Clonorchis sinensis TaxID=79923 RepID=A0A3R7GRC4_CLOSI|nr:hypothetical protein CSKR_104982 [Clonorchis sinensis]
MAQRLEREFTDRKVRGSNPTSASGPPLFRLGQPGSIPALALASGGVDGTQHSIPLPSQSFEEDNVALHSDDFSQRSYSLFLVGLLHVDLPDMAEPRTQIDIVMDFINNYLDHACKSVRQSVTKLNGNGKVHQTRLIPEMIIPSSTVPTLQPEELNFWRHHSTCKLNGKTSIAYILGYISSWMAQWLGREFIDRKVRGSNPTSASRIPVTRLAQPCSIPALVLPTGGAAVRHRKSAIADRFF